MPARSAAYEKPGLTPPVWRVAVLLDGLFGWLARQGAHADPARKV